MLWAFVVSCTSDDDDSHTNVKYLVRGAGRGRYQTGSLSYTNRDEIHIFCAPETSRFQDSLLGAIESASGDNGDGSVSCVKPVAIRTDMGRMAPEAVGLVNLGRVGGRRRQDCSSGQQAVYTITKMAYAGLETEGMAKGHVDEYSVENHRSCQNCPNGRFQPLSGHYQAACVPHHECQEGFVAIIKGSSTRDNQCGDSKCAGGGERAANESSGKTCQPCRPWEIASTTIVGFCEPALHLDAATCFRKDPPGRIILNFGNKVAARESFRPLQNATVDKVSIRHGACSRVPGLGRALKRIINENIGAYASSNKNLMGFILDIADGAAGVGAPALEDRQAYTLDMELDELSVQILRGDPSGDGEADLFNATLFADATCENQLSVGILCSANRLTPVACPSDDPLMQVAGLAGEDDGRTPVSFETQFETRPKMSFRKVARHTRQLAAGNVSQSCATARDFSQFKMAIPQAPLLNSVLRVLGFADEDFVMRLSRLPFDQLLPSVVRQKPELTCPDYFVLRATPGQGYTLRLPWREFVDPQAGHTLQLAPSHVYNGMRTGNMASDDWGGVNKKTMFSAVDAHEVTKVTVMTGVGNVSWSGRYSHAMPFLNGFDPGLREKVTVTATNILGLTTSCETELVTFFKVEYKPGPGFGRCNTTACRKLLPGALLDPQNVSQFEVGEQFAFASVDKARIHNQMEIEKFTITPVLGLFVDASSGAVVGQLNQPGKYNFTLFAVNSEGEKSQLESFKLEAQLKDTANATNGPNEEGCGNGDAVDEIKFDGRFTCNCSVIEPPTARGENCEPEFEPAEVTTTSNEECGTSCITAVAAAVLLLLTGVVLIVAHGIREHQRQTRSVDFKGMLEQLRQDAPGLVAGEATLQLRASASSDLARKSMFAQNTRSGSHTSQDDFDDDGAHGGLGEPQLRAPREIPEKRLSMLQRIGGGAFGDVHSAMLDERASTGVPPFLVAVKTPKGETRDAVANRDDLFQEAALMAQFNHRNIVALIGVVSRQQQCKVILQ